MPFFLSLILVAVGLYIRLGILETPIFRKLAAEQKIERTPMLAVIKEQPKEIILSALARMAEQAPFYIFTAFVFSYGIGTLKVSRDFLLFAVLTASIVVASSRSRCSAISPIASGARRCTCWAR